MCFSRIYILNWSIIYYKGSTRLDWECPELGEVLYDQLTIPSSDNTGEILVRIGSFANAVAAKLVVKLYSGDAAFHACLWSYLCNQQQIGHSRVYKCAL